MSEQANNTIVPDLDDSKLNVVAEVRSKEALLKTGALQSAIFNSANFSSIATDEHGVIQIGSALVDDFRTLVLTAA